MEQAWLKSQPRSLDAIQAEVTVLGVEASVWMEMGT